MTYEEALEWLDMHNVHNTPVPFPVKVYCSIALEKQIPKEKHKYMGYRCVCGEEVAKNQRYCEYCGQKLLDWSEK